MKQLILILLGVMVLAFAATYLSYSHLPVAPSETIVTLTPTPLETQDERYKRICPFYAAIFLSGGKLEGEQIAYRENSFDYSPRCSLDYSEETGDMVEVIISNTNFQAGKKQFYDWLTSHGFQEGPRLKLTFEHKPGYLRRH